MSLPFPRGKFSHVLRALRVGFQWCDSLGCFLRISGGPPWVAELATGAGVPSRAQKQNHRVWWEGDPLGAKLVETSSALRARRLAPDEEYVRLELDDAGDLVGPAC